MAASTLALPTPIHSPARVVDEDFVALADRRIDRDEARRKEARTAVPDGGDCTIVDDDEALRRPQVPAAAGRGRGSQRRASGDSESPPRPRRRGRSHPYDLQKGLCLRVRYDHPVSVALRNGPENMRLIRSISSGNAGRASPGGVTATGRVEAPQAQVPESTGAWQESHHRSRIFPR